MTLSNQPALSCLYFVLEFQPSRQNPVPGFRKHVETSLGVKPHKQSIATILQPGVKVKVRVGFQPKDDTAKTSIILIR
jgi:hypothetical protein